MKLSFKVAKFSIQLWSKGCSLGSHFCSTNRHKLKKNCVNSMLNKLWQTFFQRIATVYCAIEIPLRPVTIVGNMVQIICPCFFKNTNTSTEFLDCEYPLVFFKDRKGRAKSREWRETRETTNAPSSLGSLYRAIPESSRILLPLKKIDCSFSAGFVTVTEKNNNTTSVSIPRLHLYPRQPISPTRYQQ